MRSNCLYNKNHNYIDRKTIRKIVEKNYNFDFQVNFFLS